MGARIPQRTVSSCTPTATGRSIANSSTWHHRVPQGAFERLELLEGKLSRAVLRGLGGSNPARLPGDEETCPTGKCALSLPNPWADGTTGIRLAPLELLEKLAALVPLPHVHLVRYGGCLAPHSALREAILPTPRQQGVEEQEASTASPHWSWARLLKRVFALEMGTCPFC